MTNDEIRIAIAEACGWKYINASGKIPVGMNPLMIARGEPAIACIKVVPDYFTDLNAMHEAEKVLSRVQEWDSNGERLLTQWQKYEQHLKLLIDATARQRAEAFCRALGICKD